MGKYVNPGNGGFARIRKGKYVDKSGLIGLINERIGTPDGLVCISRPRRFGKSFAAQMLAAYYDCSCDSHALFGSDLDSESLAVSKLDSYEDHINKYNVICFDVTTFISVAKRLRKPVDDVPDMIVEALHKDLVTTFPELDSSCTLTECIETLALGTKKTQGRPFVFIIDEWDAVIREAKDKPEVQERYLNLLREWFKDIAFTPRAVAAAYMTGILPIKKDGSQSAISDFQEYPILCPDGFAEFTGFTENEVRRLCDRSGMAFEDLEAWYDGYDFPDCGPIYNPYSVMTAIKNRKCRSYWKRTSAAESLMTYVQLDFDGLQEIIVRLMAGEEIEINVDGFENDFETFGSKDDVLTLLVHLGYLTYNEDSNTVRIPNEELKAEFKNLIPKKKGQKWIELMKKSRQLLEDTFAENEQAVAQRIEEVRDSSYAPAFYNNEQALRSVIKFAFIAAVEEYFDIQEVPSGRGIGDVFYLPKRFSPLPALVIELKWNKSAGGAIAQIKDKKYYKAIEEYGGDILLVGINYDSKTGRHTCSIERVRRHESG